ncbi:MAG: nitrate reductase associated protein [Oscillatoriales cyanobacterium C42_A2020_001]|nr:nitrate reductase associated protein [Leptolyngbyaceae cyanobacterium C42_A2020_001]
MAQFFEFESDFVESLRCIPMQIRMKLDTCGIKLKLPQWNQFSQSDRQLLVDLPCETESDVEIYRTTLQGLVRERTGVEASTLEIDSSPAWIDATTIPTSVQEKATELGAAISPEQWASLTPLQRFALIKLSRSSHENRNFLPALQEFKLV